MALNGLVIGAAAVAMVAVVGKILIEARGGSVWNLFGDNSKNKGVLHHKLEHPVTLNWKGVSNRVHEIISTGRDDNTGMMQMKCLVGPQKLETPFAIPQDRSVTVDLWTFANTGKLVFNYADDDYINQIKNERDLEKTRNKQLMVQLNNLNKDDKTRRQEQMEETRAGRQIIAVSTYPNSFAQRPWSRFGSSYNRGAVGGGGGEGGEESSE